MALEQLELERLGKDGKPAYGTGTFPGREKYQQDFLKMASAIRENTSEQGNMMKAIDKNFEATKKQIDAIEEWVEDQVMSDINKLKEEVASNYSKHRIEEEKIKADISILNDKYRDIETGFKSDVAQLALNVHRFQRLVYILVGIIGLIAIIGLFV